MGRVSNEKQKRSPIPRGRYYGVVVGVYEVGTQPTTNDKFKPTFKLVLVFELHKRNGMCTTEDGKPLLASRWYTRSFYKGKGKVAAFRADVEAILGHVFTDAEAAEGIDTADLCDKVVCINVTHAEAENGGVKETLVLTPVDEDDPRPQAFTDSVVYDLAPGRPFPPEVPEWIQKKAQESKEWAAATGQRPPAERAPTTTGADYDYDDDDPAY